MININSLIFILFFAVIRPIFADDFIEKIAVTPQQLSNLGDLSEASLPDILEKAFLDKDIDDPSFKSAQCIKARALPVTGSYNTIQLFVIDSTCGKTKRSYIIKEARLAVDEARSLRSVALFPGISELLTPKKPPQNLLALALPLFYLSYDDQYKNDRTITLMPMAPGRAFCDVVKDYRDDQSPKNALRIKHIYKTLGIQLGNFHKLGMKAGSTVLTKTVHGDLHCLNVFYNEKANLFTLIDNETIADFIKKPASYSDDILKLFLGLFSTTEPAARTDMIRGIDRKRWFSLALGSFVEGYLSVFPRSQQQQVYKDLQAIFNARSNPSWLNIDPEELKQLRSRFINPIFSKK
jgi:hypothetical protein